MRLEKAAFYVSQKFITHPEKTYRTETNLYLFNSEYPDYFPMKIQPPPEYLLICHIISVLYPTFCEAHILKSPIFLNILI